MANNTYVLRSWQRDLAKYGNEMRLDIGVYYISCMMD